MQPEDRFCTGCGIALQPVEPVEPVAPVRPVAADPAAIEDEPTEQMPDISRRVQPTASDSPATPTAPAAAPEAQRSDVPAASPVGPGDDEWDADDPVWAATGAIAAQASDGPTAESAPIEGVTSQLPATEPITEVPAESIDVELDPATATPYDVWSAEVPPGDTTGSFPATTAEMPIATGRPQKSTGFRLGAVSLIALVTGSVTLISLFVNIVQVTSDTRLAPNDATPVGFRVGTWIADDLADNLSIAGLLAIVLVIAGGVAAGFHWRWGAGVAGGAGLAIAGLAALTIGLAQIPIDAAYEFVGIPSEQQFTLTITRDLGYWLTIAAGALGIVLFFAAINDASGDRRSGLNPWVAALGALAAVVAAAGPLLPENQAMFSDNWYLIEGPGGIPAMLVVSRLVQLSLLLLAGVVGFLTVRRWGLGLAIGGTVPVIWLAASTLFELTDRPVGPAYRNPGATDMHVHGVTIIGVSALAAMSVLAVIAAYDQGVRERH